MNQSWGPSVALGEPPMFRPPLADETKLGPDETIFGVGEDSRKLALATSPSNETTGRQGP
ncbi:hypothetical protein V1279_003438 [Bradyrhizobium sp. AZCC 1610]